MNSTHDGYEIYQPQNRLRQIGKNIWLADGSNVGFGIGGIKFPFPTRMTIIRLPDKKLWVHSPITLEDKLPENTLITQVRKLGKVTHLVSPNAIHHLSLQPWSEYFPEARIWASPGVRKRSSVNFSDDLDNQAADDWINDIDQRIAYGSVALEEVVFFHHASKTLILTDLIENFEPERFTKNRFRWLARLGRIERGQPPVDFRLSFLGGRRKFKPVVEWMLDQNPEQIVIAHGKWFEKSTDCQTVLKNAFGWAL